MDSFRKSSHWYDVHRTEIQRAEMKRQGQMEHNIRKARRFLESLKEDYKLLGGEEIPSYTPPLSLNMEERRSNPFYDDPASPWFDANTRPPTPETVTSAATILPDGPHFFNILNHQDQGRWALTSLQKVRDAADKPSAALQKHFDQTLMRGKIKRRHGYSQSARKSKE
jgi:hypothetical protein